MADITMPQLGETVTEGTITRWTKAPGDTIAEDEVLYEVSTDKVDSEVPSPVSGVLAEILVAEGETVAVGTVLARITDAGTSGNGAASAAVASPPPSPVVSEEPVVAAAPPVAPVSAPPVQETPPPPVPTAGSASPSDGILLSPVVRRLIAEHQLDPAQIPGTGVGRRITRNDVLKMVDRGDGAPTAVAAAPSEAPVRVAAAPLIPAGARDEIIPFTRIRRVTAEHMVRSKATSAHTVIAVEVDYLGVEKVRQARKESFRSEEGVGLTYLPFVARAVVDAIAEFPHVNSSVGDDQLIVHHFVDLGIAVDLDFHGLLVPVIRDAHDLRLRSIARQIGTLATKARTKRLSPDDLVGGTFTLTNAGPFGTFMTIPVINQPQTAIMSTDGVKKRPVAVVLPDGSDAVAIHPVGILALTFDHRAYDGAYAAAFVARVKAILETRDWSTEF